jgi:glycopeptide antibiotics resistance protein
MYFVFQIYAAYGHANTVGHAYVDVATALTLIILESTARLVSYMLFTQYRSVVRLQKFSSMLIVYQSSMTVYDMTIYWFGCIFST